MSDFNHPLVGRVVVYRDPYRPESEQGPITSVNVKANLVFVRYGRGSTSAATEVGERLTFLDGSPVRLSKDWKPSLDIGPFMKGQAITGEGL